MNKNGITAVVVIAVLIVAAVAGWQVLKDGGGEGDDSYQIKVGAASSLRYALEDLKPYYEGETGNTLEFSMLSSGTIVNSILGDEGMYDVFISADKANMDKVIGATESGGGKFTNGSVDMLTNSLSIVVNKQAMGKYGWTESTFTDFSHLTDTVTGADKAVIALGNASVPAGEYARYYLKESSLYDTLSNNGKIDLVETYSKVSDVTAAVSAGSADIAFVFTSDAMTITDTTEIVRGLSWDETGNIIYPGCVINNGNGVHDAAEGFLEWLRTSAKAREVFEQYGFGQA
ncbi:MAG: molybdate ABC transporter substrate-binding protein [Candidatus Methanoplasma sp.]|jgi:molybdenum ABC transporter molybdate-binding protein|nr:molybdate ABC transporter substrate-binding protein [Candidatus Methanoplasma sp.]